MVEHVNIPVRFSPGILFRAVKMRLLRHQGALPPLPRSLRQDGMRKRAPVRRVSVALEGLQGILVCFSPETFSG